MELANRPDAKEAAIRAILLKHVVGYALITPPRDVIQSMSKNWGPEALRDFESKMESLRIDFWSKLEGLENYFSPLEQDFSRTNALSMTHRQQLNATWRLETIPVLLWALQISENFPSYDEQSDNEILQKIPPAPAREFIASAVLRDRAEIDRARDLAELWHWRSRTRQLYGKGKPFPSTPELKSQGINGADDIVRIVSGKAHDDGEIEICDGDFAAFGKAYRDLTDHEWSLTRSITVERHFALNWLCGHAPEKSWDDTPTDT